MKIFFSHKVECLYQRMAEQLFSAATHPFAKRFLITPSPALASWLHLSLAQHFGIAAGLEIGYLDQTLNKIASLSGQTPSRVFTVQELALLLEVEIAAAVKEEDMLWHPLKQSLGKADNTFSLEKKTTSLALLLARLFQRYGLYGGELLSDWPQKKENWQIELWNRVRAQTNKTAFPCDLFTSLTEENLLLLHEKNVEIHLFSLSFIPPLYHRFLADLSRRVPVHYYILSPCQAFWSDIKSDRESRYLFNYWKTRQAPTEQLQALEEFLRDRNPLLANFGRLGREMAEQLEKNDVETEELYLLPQAIAEHPLYSDYVSEDIVREKKDTPYMIDFLHADLTLLRNPEATEEKITLSAEDRSIQMHVCPTLRREVEIMYHLILEILNKHKEEETPIIPADITVMAPDLLAYIPFINMVFGHQDSQLDYQLMEVKLFSQSRYVQTLLHLIDLAKGRWDNASLLQIFESPFIQHKHNFSREDVRKFREWIKEARISWGEDLAHRNEILKRDHYPSSLVEGKHPGTWEEGLKFIVRGLALTQCPDEPPPYAFLELIDSSAGDTLGRFIAFLNSLRSDLKPLQNGLKLTISQWTVYLETLMEAYLSIDRENKEEIEWRAAFLEEISLLNKAGSSVQEHLFPFSSIHEHLLQIVQTKTINYRETHLQAIRFCSLLPMRALPAKVVILMGMQDGVFPTPSRKNPLDLLSGEAKADYIPTQGDFDRSLFLESLLSARKYFILSYSTQRNGQEHAPSILATELFAYLDSAYEFEDSLPSAACVYKHNSYFFHESYFSANAAHPSYSIRAYRAAQSFYGCGKTKKKAFIPHFQPNSSTRPQATIEEEIDIKNLKKMAKNPVKAYFNGILGIYIQEKSKRHLEPDEVFTLNNLENYAFKEEMLRKESAEVLEKGDRFGMLPAGLFRRLACKQLTEEGAKIQQRLSNWQIEKASIFSISLSTTCEAPMFNHNRWTFPALEVDSEQGRKIKLVGTLERATDHGLLLLKERSFSDLVESWPQFLVFDALIKKHSLPWKPELLLLKDGKNFSPEGIDSEKSLEDFLAYYSQAMQNISPLLPEWTESVLASDAGSLQKAIDSDIRKSQKHFYNDYMKWTYHGANSLPDASAIIAHWHVPAQTAYAELAKAYFSSKGKKNDA